MGEVSYRAASAERLAKKLLAADCLEKKLNVAVKLMLTEKLLDVRLRI